MGRALRLSQFQPPEAHYGDFDLALLSELCVPIKSAVKGLLGNSNKRVKCVCNLVTPPAARVSQNGTKGEKGRGDPVWPQKAQGKEEVGEAPPLGLSWP